MSSLGDHLFQIALMWLTFAATRSSLPVAAIAVVSRVTYVVVAPSSGVLADRWDRRRTLIACDLVRAVILGAFVVATWRAGFSFPRAPPGEHGLQARKEALGRLAPEQRQVARVAVREAQGKTTSAVPKST